MQHTKQPRKAMDVATQLSLGHHGWKQTGEIDSLRVFEHRWPHLKDRAEGRNHGVQGRRPIWSQVWQAWQLTKQPFTIDDGIHGGKAEGKCPIAFAPLRHTMTVLEEPRNT